MTKGQISAIDVSVAIALFAAVYLLLSTSLSEVSIERDEFDSLSMRSSAVASFLLYSNGEPLNWTPSNVYQVGLVVDRGVIESEKLGNFINLSQTNLNKALDLIGIAGHKFYFNVSHLNGSALQINSKNFNGTAIVGSNFDAPLAVSSRRIAVYNGTIVVVQFKIGT